VFRQRGHSNALLYPPRFLTDGASNFVPLKISEFYERFERTHRSVNESVTTSSWSTSSKIPSPSGTAGGYPKPKLPVTSSQQVSMTTSATSADAMITIILQNELGMETGFKIKLGTTFRKVRSAYANIHGLESSSVRLLFDCRRVDDTDTPSMLLMQDNDVIDVRFEQVGD
jgi:Ubiquitin-2 like Rad60 SUMO-like